MVHVRRESGEAEDAESTRQWIDIDARPAGVREHGGRRLRPRRQVLVGLLGRSVRGPGHRSGGSGDRDPAALPSDAEGYPGGEREPDLNPRMVLNRAGVLERGLRPPFSAEKRVLVDNYSGSGISMAQPTFGAESAVCTKSKHAI